jgi:beta-lactamase regulating signal transducer with metallopeptidase domain
MTLVVAATTLCAYLLTYALHSTVALASVGLVLGKLRARVTPAICVQLWKLAIVAPMFTALAVTTIRWPHFGLELALGSPMEQRLEMLTQNVEAMQLPSAAEAGTNASARFLVTSEAAVPTATERSLVRFDGPSEAAYRSSEATFLGPLLVSGIVLLWLLVAAVGMAKLMVQWLQLCRLRRHATPIRNSRLLEALHRLRQRMGVNRDVALLSSPQVASPLAAGLADPFIVLPEPSQLRDLRFTYAESQAILAHELAHIVHRDAYWNLLIQCICRICFFQPLNFLAAKQIRQQMDFVADTTAARALGESTALASCLIRFAEKLSGSMGRRTVAAVLVSGMAAFESTLGRRIEMLLNDPHNTAPCSLWRRVVFTNCALLGMVAVALVSPRAVSQASTPLYSQHSQLPQTQRNEVMNKGIATLMVATGLALPVAAADVPERKPAATRTEAASLKTTAEELPIGIRGFNGMLVGRLAAKDAETGSFTVQVDAVSRVWENSRAENPRSIVGKTVSVGGVFGRFLDVLVVTRIGETVEFECKYDEGRLVFPGELMRKVAPFAAEEYPILPDDFRGFKGLVVAEVIKKDSETLEVILRVANVRKLWEGNSAKDANSIQGKSVMLAGFWNRREAFHELKVGSTIEVGMNHAALRSDHLMVIEGIQIIREPQTRSETDAERSSDRLEVDGATDARRGFRGMLVGRLVEKDIERGMFTVAVDAVPRVWENNLSENPKSLIGRQVTIDGVSGRLIDALVVARIGETLEFGALDEGGPNLHVGEVLHKVADVKPGDYPVLPEGFRGFRGIATAKIVRKSDELSELIVEVTRIDETFEGNRAKSPDAIVGNQLLLAGFWNRKDEYHALQVGSLVRCGMAHTQELSDHLNVIESIRVIDQK